MKTDEINQNYGEFSYFYCDQINRLKDDQKIENSLSKFQIEANNNLGMTIIQDDDCDLDFEALTKEFFNYNSEIINKSLQCKENDSIAPKCYNNLKIKEENSKTSSSNYIEESNGKIDLKALIKEKDNLLISNIEKRLKSLNVIKENDNTQKEQKTIKEVSLYEICNKKPVNNHCEHIEKFKSPISKNKFDDAINKTNIHCSDILSRLNINAEEYVPKKRKCVEADSSSKNDQLKNFSSQYINHKNSHLTNKYNGMGDSYYSGNNKNIYSNLLKRDYFN